MLYDPDGDKLLYASNFNFGRASVEENIVPPSDSFLLENEFNIRSSSEGEFVLDIFVKDSKGEVASKQVSFVVGSFESGVLKNSSVTIDNVDSSYMINYRSWGHSVSEVQSCMPETACAVSLDTSGFVVVWFPSSFAGRLEGCSETRGEYCYVLAENGSQTVTAVGSKTIPPSDYSFNKNGVGLGLSIRDEDVANSSDNIWINWGVNVDNSKNEIKKVEEVRIYLVSEGYKELVRTWPAPQLIPGRYRVRFIRRSVR